MSKYLAFAFIRKFRSLENTGVNFSPDFHFDYNPESKEISLKINNSLPKDFYSEAISGLSAIVGKNGTGKSSILQWLFQRLVSGAAAEKLDGIIIVKEKRNNFKKFCKPYDILKIYHDVEISNQEEIKSIVSKQGLHMEFINTEQWSGKNINLEIGIPLVFDSGHFDVLNASMPTDVELDGCRIISDKYLIVHDLKLYDNTDTHHSLRTINDHLQAYYIQNNLRICLLISDPVFRIIDGDDGLKDLRLPNFICFAPNTSYSPQIDIKIANLRNQLERYKDDNYAKFRLQYLTELKSVPHNSEMSGHVDKGKEKICDFLYSSLMNFYYNFCSVEIFPESTKWNALRWVKASPSLFDSIDYSSTQLPPIEWVESIISIIQDGLNARTNHHHEENYVDYVASALSFCLEFYSGLARSLKFLYGEVNWKNGIPFINVKDYEENKNKIAVLQEIMTSKAFLTERFFDLHYAHKLDEVSALSSGELALLNLLSRLRVTWKPIIKSGNEFIPSLIILDEVETSFHPEWQRLFVVRLLSFISMIAAKENPVQIIYTTHSPITLSDMPKECVNMLAIVNGKTTSLSKEEKRQTFGANVFDLYGDSFFMENGIIGEFAVKKIKQLNEDIEVFVNKDGYAKNDTEIDILSLRIEIIGDERIRHYLFSRLGMSDKDREIERLKKEIEKLKEEKSQRNERD